MKELRTSKQQKNCKKAKPQFLSQSFPHNSIVTGLSWRLLVCSDFVMAMGNL